MWRRNIPKEAGGGGFSRSQESGIYLTSITAGPRCFNLCGCSGVSPSGHPLALCQCHCANTPPRTGFKGEGGQGRFGWTGLFSHPTNSAGPARRPHSRVFPGYLAPSRDPGQKLGQLPHVSVPGSLLQQLRLPPCTKPTDCVWLCMHMGRTAPPALKAALSGCLLSPHRSEGRKRQQRWESVRTSKSPPAVAIFLTTCQAPLL